MKHRDGPRPDTLWGFSLDWAYGKRPRADKRSMVSLPRAAGPDKPKIRLSDELQDVVVANLRLAEMSYRKNRARYPGFEDECESASLYGLCVGVCRYDPIRHPDLNAYLFGCMKSHIRLAVARAASWRGDGMPGPGSPERMSLLAKSSERPGARIEYRELKAALSRYLKALPPLKAEVLRRRFLANETETHQAIGRAMGLPPAKIESMEAEALRKVAELMEAEKFDRSD